MTKTSEYKDVRWQKKRLTALEAANWTCTLCGENAQGDASLLHVHHKRYPKGKPVWDVPDEDLTVLCEPCHGGITDLKSDIGSLIAEPTLYEGWFYFHRLALAELAAPGGHFSQLALIAESLSDLETCRISLHNTHAEIAELESRQKPR